MLETIIIFVIIVDVVIAYFSLVAGDPKGMLIVYIGTFISIILGTYLYNTKNKFFFLEYPPVNEQETAPLLRWLSGLKYISYLLAQLGIVLLYFLPLLIGFFLVSLAEYYFLQNPDTAPWLLDSSSDVGRLLLSLGVGLAFSGFLFWRSCIYGVRRTAWLYHFIWRLDFFALLSLSGYSIAVFTLSFFNGSRLSIPSLLLSAVIAVASSVVAVLRFSEPLPPDPIEYDQNSILFSDRSFRFSPLKNPERDLEPRKSQQTGFRFSKLKDPEQEKDKE